MPCGYFRCNDREALHSVSRGRDPYVPHAPERHQPSLGQSDDEVLFVARIRVAEGGCGNETAPASGQPAAEYCMAVDGFDLRWNGGVHDMGVFGPGRNETPQHEIETALPQVMIIASHGHALPGRDPKRRTMQSSRPAREPELMGEFCNIGRKPYPMGQHLEHFLDDESTWCFPDDIAESTLPLSQRTCQPSLAESSVLNVVPIAR
jgi:hypothetical protein